MDDLFLLVFVPFLLFTFLFFFLFWQICVLRVAVETLKRSLDALEKERNV